MNRVHSIASRIRATPRESDPFCHINFTDVFPADLFEDLVDNLPGSEFYDEFRHGDAVQEDGSSARLLFRLEEAGWIDRLEAGRPFWRSISELLRSPEIAAALVDMLRPGLEVRFGAGAAKLPELVPIPFLFRDLKGYKIRPHCDVFTKAITCQFYLPESASRLDAGTEFYRPAGADDQTVAVDGPGNRFALAQKMRFAPNSGYAFAVHDHSWHGVQELEPGPPRDSLFLLYYLKGKGLAKDGA